MPIDFQPAFDFQPNEEQKQPSPIAEAGLEAIKTALPSPSFGSPLSLASEPGMIGAAKGGAEAALETLRDPTRISPTISQPGQIAGQKVEENIGGLTGKAAGFATSMALDPQTYILGGAGKTGEKLASVGNNVKTFFKNLFTKPATEQELAASTKGLQDTLINARRTVGTKLGELRGTQEEALDRLEHIAKKGVDPELSTQEVAQEYSTYMKSRAPLMEEAGMKAPEIGIKETPKVEVFVKGVQKGLPNKGIPDTPIYGVKGNPEEIAKLGFGKDPGSIPENVLQEHGLLPKPGEITVKGPSFPSPQDEIKYLVKLRNNMREQLSKRTIDQSGNIVKKVSSNDERAFQAGIDKINKRIEVLPGGKEIRSTEKKFSKLADIYDDLQSKLKHPEEAKEFLRRIFQNPKGKNLDYINQLKTLEEEIGTNVVTSLKEAFESTKGLTYEELKHPIASVLRKGLPNAGKFARSAGETLAPLSALALKGINTPFNNPEMQSLKDRLRNQEK